MADLLWHVGAFAQRNPETAAQLGRAHALHARAVRAMYDSVGTAPEQTFASPPSAGDCCGMCPSGGMMCSECPKKADCCRSEPGSCCAMGCCTNCRPDHDDAEMMHPEIDAAVDDGHVFEAAYRDILADPEVDDVAAAVAQAQKFHDAGDLAEMYAPKAPARDAPDGSPAPKVCPVCGAKECAACGCCCECCDSAVPAAETDDDPMAM